MRGEKRENLLAGIHRLLGKHLKRSSLSTPEITVYEVYQIDREGLGRALRPDDRQVICPLLFEHTHSAPHLTGWNPSGKMASDYE